VPRYVSIHVARMGELIELLEHSVQAAERLEKLLELSGGRQEVTGINDMGVRLPVVCGNGKAHQPRQPGNSAAACKRIKESDIPSPDSAFVSVAGNPAKNIAQKRQERALVTDIGDQLAREIRVSKVECVVQSGE
jgi:hypothetical protein